MCEQNFFRETDKIAEKSKKKLKEESKKNESRQRNNKHQYDSPTPVAQLYAELGHTYESYYEYVQYQHLLPRFGGAIKEYINFGGNSGYVDLGSRKPKNRQKASFWAQWLIENNVPRNKIVAVDIDYYNETANSFAQMDSDKKIQFIPGDMSEKKGGWIEKTKSYLKVPIHCCIAGNSLSYINPGSLQDTINNIGNILASGGYFCATIEDPRTPIGISQDGIIQTKAGKNRQEITVIIYDKQPQNNGQNRTQNKMQNITQKTISGKHDNAITLTGLYHHNEQELTQCFAQAGFNTKTLKRYSHKFNNEPHQGNKTLAGLIIRKK